MLSCDSCYIKITTSPLPEALFTFCSLCGKLNKLRYAVVAMRIHHSSPNFTVPGDVDRSQLHRIQVVKVGEKNRKATTNTVVGT